MAARAKNRAADIAPIISELKASGNTTLRGIATGLNQRGIPTATGHGVWSAVQVRRVLERLNLANRGLDRYAVVSP